MLDSFQKIINNTNMTINSRPRLFADVLNIRHFLVPLIMSIVIVIARLPSFWDKWWYGDENIYLAVGRGIAQGQLLYTDVWDNKPPGILFLYSLIYRVFETNIVGYRLVNLIFNLISFWTLWMITKKVLGWSKEQVNLSAIVFGILLSFGWEMSLLNGEVVFMPFVLLGILGLFSIKSSTRPTINYLITGLLFALAAYTKAHAAFEIICILGIWSVLQIESYNIGVIRNDILNYFKKIILFLSGLIGLMFLPYIISIVYYNQINKLSDFYFGVVGFSNGYLSSVKPIVFGIELGFIANLRWRLVLLIVSLLILSYLKVKKLIIPETYITISWLFVVIFCALISDRNYPHYLIQIFPPLALLITILIKYILEIKNSLVSKLVMTTLFVVSLNGFTTTFANNSIIPFYNPLNGIKFVQHLTNNISLEEFQRSNNTSNYDREKIILPIIEKYSKPSDKIFLVLNGAELYPLSKRLSSYDQITDFQFNEKVTKAFEKISKAKLIITYSKSPIFNEILPLIRDNYTFVEIIGEYTAWVRNI